MTKTRAILVIFFATIFLTECKKKSSPINNTQINPAFYEYISSYTAGIVSSTSAIRIVLAKDAIDSTSIGQIVSTKLFDFSPSLSGKATWVDRRTLEFKPENKMPSGEMYSVSVDLSKIFEVPKELASFDYSFKTIAQQFEMNVDNVKPYLNTELKRQKIEGRLVTADDAESATVEKMLTAKQDGKNLKISWQHASAGRQHTFVVEEVVRGEKTSSVLLFANGKTIGVERTQEQNVVVPALNDFKLMNTKVIQSPNQYVVLQFSDPIKEKQELVGLITIGEYLNQTLEYDVRDNEIWVYVSTRQEGEKTVMVEPNIRNINDKQLKQSSSTKILFEELKPAVRFLGKGSILPSTDGLILPFEAVSLKAVDVSVFKIYESNILQYMQNNNSVDGSRELFRVGKNILKTKIQLDNTGVTDLGKWNRFTLDLAKLLQTEPGAIYQISIKFKKKYSTHNCEGQAERDVALEETDALDYSGYQEYDYQQYDYNYFADGSEYFDWNERENPCNVAYYSSSRSIQKNVLASDLGLIAKKGDDGTTTVFVTDLKTTAPMSGIAVEVYDFQQQLLNTITTDSEGKATYFSKETPFALIAKKETQRGYMRLVDGESLSLSGFDVSGQALNKGLKGFIYGERGVWRPGDSLYLSFILEDKNKTLPPTHPVVFELQNPQGVVTHRLVKSTSQNGFYRFPSLTSPDAPTGNWMARVKVGGVEFNQNIKIETVKPNRLKINLDLGAQRLTSRQVQGNLNVKWLHGAPGRNLKSQFDVTVLKSNTTFPKYDDFVFEEPSPYFNSETQLFYEGFTNGEGNASVSASLPETTYPGFMTAVFKGKVFEESGNFSVDRFALPFFPFASYAGIRVPKGEEYSGMLYTKTLQKIDFVFLDIDGKPVERQNVSVNLYRLERYWWWDQTYDNVANYLEGNTSSLMANSTINTNGGKASWSFKLEDADWGTYYIKVCDPVSGHCTGKMIYVDQPGYFGRYSRDETKTAATRLTFASDKMKYNVGEKINLSIPGSGEGRALVSIENGSKILSTRWIETKKGDNKLSFDATTEMAPNIFVNVTLLQPHSQTINDLPIRLYGVIPLGIENPKTHLLPVIEMPTEIEPGQEVKIKIAEKSKRKMTFTLAMVDEGLLDITRYKTPDPWYTFYAREALGVKTWDIFDNVMGAFGARVERLLAVGGDAELRAQQDDPRANRFKAVVKYFGPYTIDGGSREIKFTMPQYIGAVKVMVVAADAGAYGNAEKVVAVRKPLMVLATLPRVLGLGEKVKLPVALFTQDKKLKDVKVEVKVAGAVSLAGKSIRSVTIPASGDMTVDFDLNVKSEIGIGKITVIASSGSITSTDDIEIEIRNPNTPVTQVSEVYLEAGKSWSNSISPVGVAGSNSSVLEVSSIPPIDLGYRLRYLIEYPHGCLEQTTSSVFPQLYLDAIRELSDAEKKRTKHNIIRGIEAIKLFIARDGGFAYWNGYPDSDQWTTSYAGHFLLSAIDKGYYVPEDMMRRWKKYQKNKAAEWRINFNKTYSYYDQTGLGQAYRLYTLALADVPDLGAMNRLRELKETSVQAKWMLAAAYAKAGQPEAARTLVANLTTKIEPYRQMSVTYGDEIRDKAIILETLLLLNEKTKAFELVREISKWLSNQYYWMSTQTVAYCLKSIGMFVGAEKSGGVNISYSYNGKSTNVTSHLPLVQVPLAIKGAQKNSINVTNTSKGGLFIRVINMGTPLRGSEEAKQSNLIMTTAYTDAKGNAIDVTKLEQSTEFYASVTIKNPALRGSYQNLALTQVFPSGWEINNSRTTDDESIEKIDRGDYQDIRDDRVYTYFNLGAGEQRTFFVSLTASFGGTFYLPGANCEAMYDQSISAKEKGKEVEVVKRAVK